MSRFFGQLLSSGLIVDFGDGFPSPRVPQCDRCHEVHQRRAIFLLGKRLGGLNALQGRPYLSLKFGQRLLNCAGFDPLGFDSVEVRFPGDISWPRTKGLGVPSIDNEQLIFRAHEFSAQVELRHVVLIFGSALFASLATVPTSGLLTVSSVLHCIHVAIGW